MCTGVVLEKLECDLKWEINAPQQTQTAVREFTCQVLRSASTTQPPCMGVMCYTDFQFAVIWDLHVVRRGMTCTQAGLTFPPLRIRVDPSWQKALCGSEGHILPKGVLRDNCSNKDFPQMKPKGRGVLGFFFMVVWDPCTHLALQVRDVSQIPM